MFAKVPHSNNIISLSFWSRRRLKYKIVSLILGSLSFIFIYGSLIEILSRAKPKNLELINKYTEEVTLLHVNWIEGEAIYLLIQLDERPEPRLYKFPWNAAQAQEFDEAISAGRESGQEVRISNPFYPSSSEERKRKDLTESVRKNDTVRQAFLRRCMVVEANIQAQKRKIELEPGWLMRRSSSHTMSRPCWWNH